MQMTDEMNDVGLSPSFNCYLSESLTSAAAVKVSREVKQELKQAAEFEQLSDIDEDGFEFSLEFSGEKYSAKELALAGRILLPIFNTDLVTKDDVDHTINILNDDVMIPLEKLLPVDNEESPGSSSSEADESEDRSSGTFCVSWRKADVRSPDVTRIRKSRSTGSEGSDQSGSRSWKIKDILRRSNSLGKETVFFLCPKRVGEACKRRSIKSGEVPKVSSKAATAVAASSPSLHEIFYVQKRAEQKGDKMRSYLPYKQELLGFKVHVNGNANKKLPF